MYKVIIQKRNDGGVGVIWPAPNALAAGETVEEMFQKANLEDGECRLAKISDLPGSREFRDAWCDVTPEARVDIDLVKAKDFQLNKLRAERAIHLASSDVAITRAMESANAEQIETLKTKRQALRNITEPLKQLAVSGYNDEAVLDQIRALGVIPQNLKD